jgi:LCP family protein required for cell wall assembly
LYTLLLRGVYQVKKLSIKRILIISGLALLIAIISTVFWFYSTIKTTAVQIHEPLALDVVKLRPEPISVKELDPISVLLLGIDEREDDRGRSDTILVVTINPTLNTAKMLSIPRDTYVEISGIAKMDKINHSYAFGGIQMAHETVQNLLQIPIDYIVSINMEGFVGLVDAINGIHVENSLAFTVDDFNYPVGGIELNGEESLSYVRMRYDDPKGDFGRQERQKETLRAIYEKVLSMDSLFSYRKLLDTVGENVRTNLTFEEMKDISKDYSGSLKNIDSYSFQEGNGQMIDHIWYYIVDSDELQHIQKELKDHLEQ